MNEQQTIDEMLANTKTIAVVGLSDNHGRASFGVSHYMQRNGYRIVPVNPQCKTVLGEISYPSLGAELIYSQAAFGSTSQRNMERIGMRVLCSRIIFTR